MRLRTGVLIAVLPLLGGCATMRATLDGWTGRHGGLTRSQRELREALSGADYPAALSRKEDDELLRVLTSGIVTYYAAQYARSAVLLDTAVLLSEERLTTSVSRNGLSLVTNDMARPYRMRRTERLFVPYYGMLAYARLGQWEDAAVEARRMVALLAADGTDRDDAERALHGGMHYLAAAVFERAGEQGEALVAYRNAHALVAAYPERPSPVLDNEGDVVVLVERGFVAHRVTETIHLTLGRDERDELRGSDESRRHAVERMVHRLAPAAASPSAVPDFGLVAAGASSSRGAEVVPRVRGPHEGQGGGDDGDDDDDHPHHLSLAFPTLRRSPRPWAGLPRLRRDSTDTLVRPTDLRVVANVDDASEVDERRERAAVIARELGRAAAKYALTRTVEEKKGEVAGRLAEMGANLMERADVRSWHVLPQEIVILRIRMPAGSHDLAVDVGEGANARRVELGPLTVKRGAVTIAAARFWREPAYDPDAHCARHDISCRY